MEKRHTIKIKMIQDGLESIWESEGILTRSEGIYTLTYPDYTSNTQTDNRLEVGKEKMQLLRSGAITSRMVFEENMVTAGTYNVMFYNTDVEVYTKSYKYSEDESTICIEVDYQMLDKGLEIVSNQLEITIEK